MRPRWYLLPTSRAGLVSHESASPVVDLALFGSVERDGLIEDWRVGTIRVERGAALFFLDDGDGECILEVRPDGPGVARGPFDSGTAAIVYRHGTRASSDCVRAGEALTRALRADDGGDLGRAVTEWLPRRDD